MLNEFKIAETETYSSQIKIIQYDAVYKKIYDFVYPQLRSNPFFGSNIKKLKGEFEGIYRCRVGNYRLFYTVDKKKIIIFMLNIFYRKDAFK